MSGRVALFCCFCLFALTSYTTLAMTPEQKAIVHEHFEKLGLECLKDYMISEEDIVSLKTRKVPTGENAPCFLACVMKKTGLMDANGMLQKEDILEMAKKVFENDEELKMIEDYLHSCSHVNNESTADGDKGCERATMAFKCMLDNASQFGFDM